VGDTEQTATDRKRQRRKKKVHKHIERVEREALDAKKDEGVVHESGNAAKRRAMDKLKKTAKQGGVVRGVQARLLR
jgi:hypothetical protein